MAKVLVIGVGNEILGNDGIGLAILKQLKKLELPPQVEIMLAGTDCWAIINKVVNYQVIIVIDGITTGSQEGKIYFIPATELMPAARPYSLHDFTWLELFQVTGLMEKTFLFGVEIDTLNMGLEISPSLKVNLGFYVAKLYEIVALAADPASKNALEFSRVFGESQINMDRYSSNKKPGYKVMDNSDFI